MSRIKNMPRLAWLVIGIALVVLLIPTTVGAVAAITYNGIEGKTGNKAIVSPAGQLLTTPADPNSLYESGSSLANLTSSNSPYEVGTPPSGSALIITSLAVDTYSVSSPGPNNVVNFYVQAGSCSGSQVGSWTTDVNPPGVGVQDVPLGSGFAIPAGDALCLYIYGSPQVNVWAAGYSVPSSEVAAEPEHAASAIQQQP
jgi:hypothetical protein